MKLGESVKATFSNPVAGGGIHPLTKYVMNYLRILTDYGETLNFLFEDSADADSISLSPDTSPTSDEALILQAEFSQWFATSDHLLQLWKATLTKSPGYIRILPCTT
ncbi:hypothetical protein ACFX10_023689 [Malus domestica]